VINFKIILIFVHSISRESLYFDQIRTKRIYTFLTSIFEPSQVYSRTKESYRLQSRTATVPGGCSVSISFTTASRSSFSLSARSCIFFSSLTHPWLPLHSAKPFGRYSAPSLQILYHFYEA